MGVGGWGGWRLVASVAIIAVVVSGARYCGNNKQPTTALPLPVLVLQSEANPKCCFMFLSLVALVSLGVLAESLLPNIQANPELVAFVSGCGCCR